MFHLFAGVINSINFFIFDFFSPGYYMFMEASAPRVQGDKTWFVSSPFPAFSSGSKCFIFWYFMKGRGIGSLNVYIDDTTNTTHTLTWTQSGDKGSNWLQGKMPIPPQSKEYMVCSIMLCFVLLKQFSFYSFKIDFCCHVFGL